MSVKLSKRTILAILAGIITIIFIQYMATLSQSMITRNIISQLPITSTLEEFKSAINSTYTQHPYATWRWILNTSSFLSPLIGGLIVGWLAREKGALYGGIVGIIITFLSIGNILYIANFVPQFPPEEKAMVPQIIGNYLLSSPITIMLTAFGGYLGERFQKINLMNKKS